MGVALPHLHGATATHYLLLQ